MAGDAAQSGAQSVAGSGFMSDSTVGIDRFIPSNGRTYWDVFLRQRRLRASFPMLPSGVRAEIGGADVL